MMELANTNERHFFPNLFIIGAAKCGTTTLYDYLVRVPEICLTDPKEPMFFECDDYYKGLEYYHQHYLRHWRGERYMGDARHRHLYLPYTAQRLYETNPNAKLIVILRNPISRIYSHWWWWYQRNEYEKDDFETAVHEDYTRIQRGEFIDTPEMMARYNAALDKSGFGLHRTYLDTGHYAEQLERFLTYFPREQVKVVFMEDMQRTPSTFLEDVLCFLGVDAVSEREFVPLQSNIAERRAEERLKFLRPLSNISKTLHFVSYIPEPILDLSRRLRYRTYERPEMSESMRQWLYEYYLPHNQHLEKLLSVDLSHWK